MPTPVQARSLDTRARLLAVGRVAFSERGHDAVNLTADILEPAGVSVGSFYHQFSDKTELLIAILDEAAAQRTATVLVRDPLDRRKRSLRRDLAELVERFFVSLDDDAHLWLIQVRERTNADPRIRQRILSEREAWLGELRQYFAPHNHHDDQALSDAVQLVQIFCIGLVAAYLGVPPAVRRDRSATLSMQVADFLYRGMRPLLAAPGGAPSP